MLAMVGEGGAEGFQRLLDGAADLYEEMARVNELPYAQFAAAEAELDKKIEKSQNPLAKLFLPVASRARHWMVRAQVQHEMLRAGIALLQDGQEKLKEFKSPADGEPFGYRAFDGGFELTSKLEVGQKPVQLLFGVPVKKANLSKEDF